MKTIQRIAAGSVLAGLITFMSGCIVEPHEGYYDHDHARYYHEHSWHPCNPGNDFCH